MAAVLARCLECCPVSVFNTGSTRPERRIRTQAKGNGLTKRAHMVGELFVRFIHSSHRLRYLQSQIDITISEATYPIQHDYSTAMEWRGDDFDTPCRLPRCLQRLPHTHSNPCVPAIS